MPESNRHHVAGGPGVLLVNLGTPDAPRTPEVRRYLREFLSDPRVLDLSRLGRAALLNLVILPTRPQKSAAAYREIWTDDGSPLLFHSRALERGVQESLGDDVPVVLAMRYGNPSIPAGVRALVERGCDEIVVLPLYPQYASSSTGSTVEAVYRACAEPWNTPFVRVLPPFYDDDGYLDAVAQVSRPHLDEFEPDHVLFSYHGVPERHVTKSDPTGTHCMAKPGCCDVIGHANRMCYRAHCFATTRELVARLGLADGSWSQSFQSRLGRTPWLQPFTDVVVPDLAKAGKKRLAVMCPSFVADCLETLEEIGIRAREDFRAAGGDDLTLVPSVNGTAPWVRAVASLVTREIRDEIPTKS